MAADERLQIEQELAALQVLLNRVPRPDSGGLSAQHRPSRYDPAAAADPSDAQIFHKAVTWALRYETEFQPADLVMIQKGLARCRQRAGEIAEGRTPWFQARGRLARGYRSAVDGSTQPYGLVVPASYDGAEPIRLDVVLHGSTRPVGLSELRFIVRFDEGDALQAPPPQTAPGSSAASFIELHPLGRVENCYRWAGETDVFEAIEDVCRKYNIDRRRIVLRGMSMGASGTWHLGLKHPDVFVALGPYCGYVDTHQFSLTPLASFVKVGPLPPHQELGLHMLDSIDYAANAGVVPAIACMGEKDVFFQAHVIMEQAMSKEGLQMVNLISPGTGHVIDPVTHREQMRRIDGYARDGLNASPRNLRFVTWTLKYNRCHWLELLGLGEHYARAELAARIGDDGALTIDPPRNVTRFAIDVNRLPVPLKKLVIGNAEVTFTGVSLAAAPATDRSSERMILDRADGNWRQVKPADTPAAVRFVKRPGLQGPIDDAFTTSFLCVRGTGAAWHPEVQAYADASLKRFTNEFSRYFRGDLTVKDDTQVTAEDVARSNLILFGDPGSNLWIARALPDLPIHWTRDELRVGEAAYPAASHLPALIHPSPFPGGKDRYLVLNSGHTFRESELALLNYLLFPRWGDWAVLKIGDPAGSPPGNVMETVLQAGYFDEQWRMK